MSFVTEEQFNEFRQAFSQQIVIERGKTEEDLKIVRNQLMDNINVVQTMQQELRSLTGDAVQKLATASMDEQDIAVIQNLQSLERGDIWHHRFGHPPGRIPTSYPSVRSDLISPQSTNPRAARKSLATAAGSSCFSSTW